MWRVSIAVVSLVLAATQAQTVVRTGDPYKRGLKDTDFPRVQKLAEGVYSYEQLRSAGAEKFTTVSLFVVTTAGVLVADGQGSVAETQRMVDEIAKVTPRPITHVVIGSDHGDHTAGNKAFPSNVKYYVHPTSQAILKIPGAELVPDRTAIRVGQTDIEIRFLGRAHTGGDLAVYLPKEKILFMSEIYLNRIFPAMRSAYPSEWVAAIEKAQAMDVNVYVPGPRLRRVAGDSQGRARDVPQGDPAGHRRSQAAARGRPGRGCCRRAGEVRRPRDVVDQREPGRDRDSPRLPRARRQATSAGRSSPHPRIAGQPRAGRTCRAVREAGGAGPRRRA